MQSQGGAQATAGTLQNNTFGVEPGEGSNH